MTNAMSPVAALEVLIKALPEDAIVVTNQGSARIWPKLTRRSLDLHYNPSTMGGAVPLALGLALAQPQRQVICVTGDGALLMNLGSLVTVEASRADNLTIIVLDNGLYEVTGGQKTPGRKARARFDDMAIAAGFHGVGSYSDLANWEADVPKVLAPAPNARLVSLMVEPTLDEYLTFRTPPIVEQLANFRSALGEPTR